LSDSQETEHELSLGYRDLLILKLREKGETYEAIGAQLGLSRERVRQLEKRVRSKATFKDTNYIVSEVSREIRRVVKEPRLVEERYIQALINEIIALKGGLSAFENVYRELVGAVNELRNRLDKPIGEPVKLK